MGETSATSTTSFEGGLQEIVGQQGQAGEINEWEDILVLKSVLFKR